MRNIDRMPNPLTGDVNRDLQSIYDYLIYLREQMNMVIAQIEKKGE